MAIIKCNECGKDISDKAKICPHCGWSNKQTKQPKERSNTFKILVPIAVTILVFIGGIIGFIAITKGIEKYKENEILQKIEGTWYYSEVSKANGGVSYDMVTFTKNKKFKTTSGFIFQGDDTFKYSFEGTASIYSDGEIWLYTDSNAFIGHFIYDEEFDELYEETDDQNQKQYHKR